VVRDTLIDFFADLSLARGEFLVHDDGFRSRSFSYAEVACAARGFAAALHDRGIRKGLPAYVAMDQVSRSGGPNFLGAQHAPFVIDGYPNVREVCWVQEEPENMGAWRYLRIQFLERLLDRFPFRGVYRPAAASPATGSYSSHKKEQETLLNQAFDV